MRSPEQSVLRPITRADHADVLALNQANVELLAPLDQDRLEELLELADRADVIELDDAFAGFVITFRHGTAYDSVNYRWFSETYDAFYYLDRVVLHERTRRRGLATRVYDELEAAADAPVFALEVNLEPPNEASLAFHRNRGFAQVHEQLAGDHLVGLMVKSLGRAAGRS
jgi:predicted GNAT superfamily acetyltransferase